MHFKIIEDNSFNGQPNFNVETKIFQISFRAFSFWRLLLGTASTVERRKIFILDIFLTRRVAQLI